MPQRKRISDFAGSKHLQRPKNIFVVHGRNKGHRDSVAKVIKQLKYNPIILDEQPNGGKTIIEKFEAHSDVVYAVVLLSADDCGGLKVDSPKKYNLRARQNVILELGYFWGKLGRNKVCALYDEGVELPSDYANVGFVTLDSNDEWKIKLATEMKTANLRIDLDNLPF